MKVSRLDVERALRRFRRAVADTSNADGNETDGHVFRSPKDLTPEQAREFGMGLTDVAERARWPKFSNWMYDLGRWYGSEQPKNYAYALGLSFRAYAGDGPEWARP